MFQALTVARLDAKDYPFIQNSVKGILFLSTPHRGSDSVKWPLVLANILNASSLGLARKDLLKSLERNSEELLSISKNFRNQVEGVRIISFYEQNTTPPLSGLVSCSWLLPNLQDAAYLIATLGCRSAHRNLRISR